MLDGRKLEILVFDGINLEVLDETKSAVFDDGIKLEIFVLEVLDGIKLEILVLEVSDDGIVSSK